MLPPIEPKKGWLGAYYAWNSSRCTASHLSNYARVVESTTFISVVEGDVEDTPKTDRREKYALGVTHWQKNGQAINILIHIYN